MSLLARDLMHPDPLTVASGTPVLQVLHLFVVAQIGGAPVVDDRGQVVGVISRTDLLRMVDQAFDEDLDADEPDDAGGGEAHLRSLTAMDLATPCGVWVSPETSAGEVAKLMRAEGLHRVLVGRDGQLAGILTTFDLLRAVTS